MTSTKYINTLLLLVTGFFLYGQNITDVVRWSETSPGGTARTFGVGGSFGAMGGDFSVININPAGIGEYAKGEFMFTPSINLYDSDAYLVGDKASVRKEEKSSLLIDNIGLVTNRNPIGSQWTHSNFAIGFTKISDLNNSFYFNGKTAGSITEEFAEYANGRSIDDLDDFRAWPAYRVGAIYDFDEDGNYETDFQESPMQPIDKAQYVDQDGYINELSFAWGGKYDNRINFGVSVGVPFVSFEETKVYSEIDPDDEVGLFDELEFTEYLNTSGVGFNFKAGMIYEVSKLIRLGGAIHSPTWYTLNDDYYTAIEYQYTGNEANRFDHRSPDGSFRYSIQTPWKVVGSLGSIYRIGDDIVGFVNADVEWLDYAEAELDLTTHSNSSVEATKTNLLNREINQRLGSALNLRLGSELGYNKLRLRAGIESAESPFVNDSDRINSISFGIGLREDRFFIDAGLRIRNQTTGYLPYTVLDKERDPLVNVEHRSARFLITAGFKF